MKVTPTGAKVVSFSLATGRKYRNQKTGQTVEETEYHDLVAWGRTAEIIGQYCIKGSQIYIRGRLTTRSWDDKNTGQKRYKTEVVIEEMSLGAKPGGASRPNNVADAVSTVFPGAEQVEDLPTINQDTQGGTVEDIPF